MVISLLWIMVISILEDNDELQMFTTNPSQSHINILDTWHIYQGIDPVDRRK